MRAGLVGERTRLKNRVQSLLAQLLVEPPVTVLVTKQGRRKAGEAPPKKLKKRAAGAEPVAEPAAGRLNETYRRSALPATKSPEEWAAGEHRARAAAGATAFVREVHTEPVKPHRARTKAKAQSRS